MMAELQVKVWRISSVTEALNAIALGASAGFWSDQCASKRVRSAGALDAEKLRAFAFMLSVRASAVMH
jgi:hypothetical protein